MSKTRGSSLKAIAKFNKALSPLEKLAQGRNLDLDLDTLLRNDFLEIIWN